jgi:hypothetical protein
MRKMSTKRATGKKDRPKTKLGIPDLWNTRKPQSSGASVLRIRGADISMLLTSSLRGTVRSRDWHSIKPAVLRYRFHLEERGLGYVCFPTMARDSWLDPLRGNLEFSLALRTEEGRYREAAQAFLAAAGSRILGVRPT